MDARNKTEKKTAGVLPDLQWFKPSDYRNDRYWTVAGYATVLVIVEVALFILLAFFTHPLIAVLAGVLFVPLAVCVGYLDRVDSRWIEDGKDDWAKVRYALADTESKGE